MLFKDVVAGRVEANSGVPYGTYSVWVG